MSKSELEMANQVSYMIASFASATVITWWFLWIVFPIIPELSSDRTALYFLLSCFTGPCVGGCVSLLIKEWMNQK